MDSGFGALHLGVEVEDPEALLASHDVVFVATGRHWPTAAWRLGRGLELSEGRSEEALIVKFLLAETGAAERLRQARSGVGRFEVPGQPSYVLRPGVSDAEGWLWVLGLAPELLRQLRERLDVAPQHSRSFQELWSHLTTSCASKRGKKHRSGTKMVLAYLDQLLRPNVQLK